VRSSRPYQHAAPISRAGVWWLKIGFGKGNIVLRRRQGDPCTGGKGEQRQMARVAELKLECVERPNPGTVRRLAFMLTRGYSTDNPPSSFKPPAQHMRMLHVVHRPSD
jgi:hypothetical protein